MHRMFSLRVFLVVVAGVALSAAATGAPQPPEGGQTAGQAAPAGPLASEVYKNIQVLTDIAADQLEVTMLYVAASTGLECGSCHVRDEATGTWAYDSDDLRAKQTARRMMRMLYAINAGDFGVRAQCATCHAGQNRPPGLPLATMATADEIASMAAPQAAASPAAGQRGGREGAGPGGRQGAGRGPQGPPPPEPTEIVGDYLDAVGREAAVSGLESIAMTGTLTDRFARSMDLTIEEKAPNRFRETLRSDAGETVQAFDGTTGWTQNEGAVTELAGFRLQQALRVASLPLGREIADQAVGMRAGRPTRIDGRQVNVLQASPSPEVTVRLYFDAETSLLVRRVISTRTVLGSLPEQIDYDDYRSVAGVRLPFVITRTTWNAMDSFRISDIQANAPLDDSIFARPDR